MMNRFSRIASIVIFVIASIGNCLAAETTASTTRPTLFIIGDSTVRNRGEQVGWGTPIAMFFDASRINVENDAIAGRSSRTFLTEGRWDKVLEKIHIGDFLMMQFGHNDDGSLKDPKARASLHGTGDETHDAMDNDQKKIIPIRTYGWYLRKFTTDAQAKGATVIILSPVPRNRWAADGKVTRISATYGKWAADVAKQTAAYFIDLNELVAEKYDPLGQAAVKTMYFTIIDDTHTNAAGAKLTAQCVIEGIEAIKDCPLNKFVLTDVSLPATQPAN